LEEKVHGGNEKAGGNRNPYQKLSMALENNEKMKEKKK